jgi:hypothetical protein
MPSTAPEEPSGAVPDTTVISLTDDGPSHDAYGRVGNKKNLGRQSCRDHEGGGGSPNNQKLAEHDSVAFLDTPCITIHRNASSPQTADHSPWESS